jgi:dihydroflavonol-4-reductase
MKVLITGGTGYVGSHTVAAVKRAGHDVKLLVRSPDRIAPALKPLGVDTVEHVVGDVNDAPSIEKAMAGCQAVIHAGSAFAFGLRPAAAARLVRTNVQGTENVLSTAHRMGLGPIIHVSSTVALVQSKGQTITPDLPVARPPSPYARSKAESEAVARRLQDAGAPVAITYPGVVLGPNDPHWGESSQLVTSLLKGYFRRAPSGTLACCDVRDVAALHVAILQPGRAPGRYLAPMSKPNMPELVAALSEATGREFKTSAVPAAPMLAMARLLDALQMISPLRFPINYYGIWFLTRNISVDDSKTRRDFGLAPRPLAGSFSDMVRWMATTGKIDKKLAGKLAT